MKKITILLITLFAFKFVNAQVNSVPNSIESQKYNESIKETGETDMFNNINHPLAITGGTMVLGGAITYIVGSNLDSKNNNYQPRNTTQYIGMGVFAAGAVLFAIFSTERGEKVPKHKKEKKYNASDWEIQE